MKKTKNLVGKMFFLKLGGLFANPARSKPYLGATIWNSLLENSLKETKSCNSFKHKVKDKFFKQIKLKEEDVYSY